MIPQLTHVQFSIFSKNLFLLIVQEKKNSLHREKRVGCMGDIKKKVTLLNGVISRFVICGAHRDCREI